MPSISQRKDLSNRFGTSTKPIGSSLNSYQYFSCLTSSTNSVIWILITFTSFCLQNWVKLTAWVYLISSRLGRVWFSSTTAGLARLGRPRGAETRRRPCTVRVGDRYKVKCYKREVLIALVSVLNIMPLAVIYMVIYIYITNSLKLDILLTDLG